MGKGNVPASLGNNFDLTRKESHNLNPQQGRPYQFSAFCGDVSFQTVTASGASDTSDAIPALPMKMRQIYSAKYAVMTQFGHKFYEDTNATLQTCASPSQKFISKSMRPRLSKKGNVVVVVIVVVVVVAILRYLGLCREARLKG